MAEPAAIDSAVRLSVLKAEGIGNTIPRTV
jgi:4-hydroxy-3-methylbut-2-en-1-yl diphosphate synthase IspG/GcpE